MNRTEKGNTRILSDRVKMKYMRGIDAESILYRMCLTWYLASVVPSRRISLA